VQRKRFSILLLSVALLAAFAQFTRGVDFEGYYRTILSARLSGFREIPYPTGPVEQGAYFQSPVTTLLLAPFTYLSLFTAKLVWALLVLLGLVAVARRWMRSDYFPSQSLFLFLLFTYPLTDIFLSGNTNALLFLCLLLGGPWLWGAGIFIKPHVLLLFPLRPSLRLAAAAPLWFLITLPLLGLEWWRRWWTALSYYPGAAGPGRVSFQSPPAMLYRVTENLTLANALGIAFGLTGIFLAVKKPRAGFPIMMAVLYLVTPFSWASAILFLLPLALIYLDRGKPSLWAWVFVLPYALLQKAFLPTALWDFLIHRSLHGFCLLGLITLFILRLFGKEPGGAKALRA